jgi:hypothetical protein
VSTVEYLDSIRGFTLGTLLPEPEDTTTTEPTDTTTTSGIYDVLVPEQITIHPNPFLSELNVRLNLKKAAALSLSLFDITGKMVADLGRKNLTTGSHLLQYDMSQFGLKPGMYHLVISDDSGGRIVKKMMRIQE